MDSLLSENEYVRVTDGKTESPLTKVKRGPVSLATVEPVMDKSAMELVDRNMNKEKCFLQQLSHGKGTSIFELKLGEVFQSQQDALSKKEALNMTDMEGMTMLHHAARCNMAAVVKNLLDKGADIDIVSESGYTALHIAVRFFCADVVEVLLQRGADPSIADGERDIPLHFAARQGGKQIISLLLKDRRSDVNCPNSAKMTPFHMACKNGNRSICEMLLSHGADIMAKSASLMTSLHFAASYGNEEVCELLISKASKQQLLKSYLDAVDNENASALHYSSQKGYTRVMKLLLRHGADYELTTSINGSSPLQLAVMNGHCEVVRLLISKGAAVDNRNSRLQTPLHKAALYNQTGVAEVLLKSGANKEAKDMMDLTPLLTAAVHGSKDMLELLLDSGANLTAVNALCNSALHLAVQNGQVEMVELLLRRGKDKLMPLRNNDLRGVIHVAAAREDAKILDIVLCELFDPELRDINEKIPLHIAAESGSLQCVRSLLNCNMLLIYGNDRDKQGMTPLHLAALNKHSKTCCLLISKGADVTAHDNNHCTPLHLAVKAGSLKTAKVLLSDMLPNTLEEKDVDGNAALHIACMYNRLDVLKFLIDRGADLAARNNRNMTCLDMAIEWDSWEVAATLVRNKRWLEVVCSASKEQIPPMEKLIEAMPDVAEIVLDQCLTQSALPISHPDYSVTFNFEPLDPGVSVGKHKFFAPGCMATYRRERLLNHCVTQALLRLKWTVLGKFVSLFNFLVFSIFVVLFTVVIISHRTRTQISFSGVNASSTDISPDIKGVPFVIFTFLILELANEFFQMFWMGLVYFKDFSNLVDFVLYISVTIYIMPFVSDADLYGDAHVQWTSGAIGLLLCYFSIVLSLRRVSSVALYVTMYLEVLLTFLKVISVFTVVLIGYTLVFFVLLKEEDNFSTFWVSIVKVFVMMLGEMDYSDMLTDNVVNDNTVPNTNIPYVPLPVLSYVVFFLFVLSVSIILMNLLVGLAVGDIDSIQKTATLRTLVDQALAVENIQNKYPSWILRRAHKRSWEVKLNQNTFSTRFLLASSGLTSQGFIEELRAKATNQDEEVEEEDFADHEKRERKKQTELIRTLQATVEEQGKLLRALAEKMELTQ